MFNLSEEHIQLQQTFREFAENEVKPLAKELDETERFPTETVQKMAEMGMMGLPIPEELDHWHHPLCAYLPVLLADNDLRH